MVCKKEANVVTHSSHYFSEAPTGLALHGRWCNPDALPVYGGCSFYFGYGQDGCPAENFDYHSIATPQKNNICPHIENKCSVLPSRGCSLKSGIRVCEALKTLFPRPCGLPQDSISVFHLSKP